MNNIFGGFAKRKMEVTLDGSTGLIHMTHYILDGYIVTSMVIDVLQRLEYPPGWFLRFVFKVG